MALLTMWVWNLAGKAFLSLSVTGTEQIKEQTLCMKWALPCMQFCISSVLCPVFSVGQTREKCSTDGLCFYFLPSPWGK